MAKKKPNFSNFGKDKPMISTPAKSKVVEVSRAEKEIVTRHVQVRLSRQDAIRFKRAAEDNGLTQHDGLVEAINLMLRQWGEAPVSNLGAAKKL